MSKPRAAVALALVALSAGCAAAPPPDRWERQARFNCLAGHVTHDCQTALRQAAAENLDPWLEQKP